MLKNRLEVMFWARVRDGTMRRGAARIADLYMVDDYIKDCERADRMTRQRKDCVWTSELRWK